MIEPALPPRVDGDGLAIFGAHYAPIGVGFAADDHHVDLGFRKYADRLVRRGFEPGSHRLLAERRPRIDVILHQLQIPIAPGWHFAALVDEADEFLLGVEAAAVDELARRYRIEQEARHRLSVDARQHVANVIAPIFFAKPQAKRRRAAAEENTYGGIGRLESLLHVQRLPGAFLLVLRKGG